MTDNVRSFLDEFPAIRQVWRSFLIALAIASLAIWWAMNWAYGARIERLRDQVDSKTEEVSELSEKLKLAEEKATTAGALALDLKPVSNCRYTNQSVEIDGKLFTDCTFENVTLIWKGTGQWAFIRATFLGRIVVHPQDGGRGQVYMDLVSHMASMARRGKFEFVLLDVSGKPATYREPDINWPALPQSPNAQTP